MQKANSRFFTGSSVPSNDKSSLGWLYAALSARGGTMTQVHLAKNLGVNQAAVSKLERRADMHVSTLQSFVKAMGGELKITARFPEGTVEISQFEDVKKAAGE